MDITMKEAKSRWDFLLEKEEMDNFVRVVIIQYSIEKWEFYVELHRWLNDITV